MKVINTTQAPIKVALREIPEGTAFLYTGTVHIKNIQTSPPYAARFLITRLTDGMLRDVNGDAQVTPVDAAVTFTT